MTGFGLIVDTNAPAPTNHRNLSDFWMVSAPTHAKIPKTQYFDGISILMAGMGRVYEIVDLYQILLVNPPLRIMVIYPYFLDVAGL